MEDSGGRAPINDSLQDCQDPFGDPCLVILTFGDLLAENDDLACREQDLLAVLLGFLACATLQRDDDIVELAAGVRCICEPVGEEPCTSLVVFGRFSDV
jgi:hypothetical protein